MMGHGSSRLSIKSKKFFVFEFRRYRVHHLSSNYRTLACFFGHINCCLCYILWLQCLYIRSAMHESMDFSSNFSYFIKWLSWTHFSFFLFFFFKWDWRIDDIWTDWYREYFSWVFLLWHWVEICCKVELFRDKSDNERQDVLERWWWDGCYTIISKSREHYTDGVHCFLVSKHKYIIC